MPELPEVEVVRRGLEKQLVGKTIQNVEIRHQRTLRGISPERFAKMAHGFRISQVVRRGKFIWLVGSRPDSVRELETIDLSSSKLFKPINQVPAADLIKNSGAQNSRESETEISLPSEQKLALDPNQEPDQSAKPIITTRQEVNSEAETNGITQARAVQPGIPLPAECSRDCLLIHLGMSGQCLVNPPAVILSPRATSHLRVRLIFEEGLSLNFIDQRTFGRFTWNRLVQTTDGGRGGLGSELPWVPDSIAEKIGRDCLDPALDLRAITRLLKNRQGPIKNLLLDQAIVSGIGNIYADEALYECKVNPFTSPRALKLKTISQLYQAAAAVMERALAQGGTSFDSLYVNTDGDPGYFVRSLNVYGRKGRPCKRCGSSLEQTKIAGRSATFCPLCQKLTRRRLR